VILVTDTVVGGNVKTLRGKKSKHFEKGTDCQFSD
jgi:hypothetical protein